MYWPNLSRMGEVESARWRRPGEGHALLGEAMLAHFFRKRLALTLNAAHPTLSHPGEG